MSLGNPPAHKRGDLRVASREWGPGGAEGANRASRAPQAHPPPTDQAPARQVTFQVTYGVRWGLNGLTGGWGGGNLALYESGPASAPCDWPHLAMVAGAHSL